METQGAPPRPEASSTPRNAAAGLAALGAVFSLSESADAGIVYSGIQNISVSWHDSSYDFDVLDIDKDSKSDLRFGGIAFPATASSGGYGWAGIGADGKGFSTFAAVGVTSSSGLVRNVKAGELILDKTFLFGSGAFLHYFYSSTSSMVTVGNFLEGETGIAPFYLFTPGGLKAGWIRLMWEDLEGDPRIPNKMTVIDWAYNDELFEPIAAGDTGVIPEGNGLYAMLGLGGVGLAAWRARRRSRATAPAA